MSEAWWHPLVLGGLAGSIGELVAQPMIVVRTRVMVQGVSTDAGIVRYGGFVDACRTMLRTEGIKAFYKGAAVNAAFTPACRGLYMGGVELSKSVIGEGTALKDFAAGTSAQLIGSLAYVPRDVIIERCAIDGQIKSQVGSCSSSIEALRTMLAHGGMRGFYRAFLPHQFVWIPYNGLFFALLGRLSLFEQEVGMPTNSFAVGVANTAACAAVAGWVTTPIDVIKTRVQVSGANPELFDFEGPLDCAVKLVRREGPRALFSGAVGRMMYLAPNMAIFIPVYEKLKSLVYDAVSMNVLP
eukprot:CAMPEP_0172814576 /NCGR_PEP_ID=MMETSP1075-20121228/11304_1 /TAXON_ID=2916 /ORGANISM="Ceratium fusus, Strain PA161109" /LENGTH=297 /DNA_ID=CAMNT_0013654377 /DNA_START=40 /DNA_END=930 /DNA_ORIENTATION=+